MIRQFHLNQAASDYLIDNLNDGQIHQLNKLKLKTLSSGSVVSDGMLMERFGFIEQDIENILSLGAVDVTYALEWCYGN